MAVGSVWTKNDAGVWVQGQPYFKTSNGWLTGGKIYEKTDATTWTLRYDADLTPPGVISLTNGTWNTSNMSYTMTVKLPADADTYGGCIKIGKTAYPTNPGVLDSNCYTNTQADGQPYWLWTGAANSTTTRTTPGGLVSGSKFYVSGWARDASGNWSTPFQFNGTVPYPPAPVKTLTTKTAYVNTTDSASWRSAYGWRTDNNYVYQGGDYNYQGFWFYGTQIASLLKNAHSVTKIEVYIQRVNSSHGIIGDGNIMVGHHDLTSQPSGSPGTNRVVGEYNLVDLGRGEGKWATVTSGWYSSFKSGSYRGLGTMYQTTGTSSSYYNICYGKGTSSGKLKLTWTEYV